MKASQIQEGEQYIVLFNRKTYQVLVNHITEPTHTNGRPRKMFHCTVLESNESLTIRDPRKFLTSV